MKYSLKSCLLIDCILRSLKGSHRHLHRYLIATCVGTSKGVCEGSGDKSFPEILKTKYRKGKI